MSHSIGSPTAGALRPLAALLLSLSTALLSAQVANKPATTNEPSTVPVERAEVKKTPGEDVLTLSPFVVTTTKDEGYFAENTLAGSRLNSNLADLASSISVVTKQQMEDTAALDINDVFKYEANTEGSATYQPTITDRGTMKDSVSGYTSGGNTQTTTNAQSNRIRGLAAPDASINYYPTNSRIPFDSYNTQSVEISRGPNSLLFGLGSPAGIVNQTSAQAALNKNTNQLSLRTDHNGSFRSSFAINRSIIDDKLAVYLAVLYNDQQFERKPSQELTRRQFAAVTFKPFKKTVIRAFAENYDNFANRPNFLTPRDFVTPWIESGRPMYDPVARTITLEGGRVVGPYIFDTRSPGYNASVRASNGAALIGAAYLTNTLSPYYLTGITFDDLSRPIQYIDGGVPALFFQRQPTFYRPAQTNPATAAHSGPGLGWATGDARYAIFDRAYTSSSALPIPTAAINGVNYTYSSWQNPGVTNRSIYDWTQYNSNEMNFGQTRAGNYNIELEQQLTDNLFFSAGWFRQDIDASDNYTMSQTTGATLTIDTNVRLPDGSENPYAGLPYLQESNPDTFYQPETDDNYRAMLAYNLDFSNHQGWTRWLGRHRLLGLWSEQKVKRQVERWRNVFVSGDAEGTLRYVPNLTIPGTSYWNSTNLKRNYYLASPGDPRAQVTQSGGFYNNLGWQSPYTTNVRVFDYLSSPTAFKNVSLTESTVFVDAGSKSFERNLESWNLASQSYFLGDRLVTTIGFRHDEYEARSTSTGILADENGNQIAPGLTSAQLYSNGIAGYVNRDLVMSRWDKYDRMEGDTKTVGGALRPLQGWSSIERRAAQGSFVADALRGMTLYYNQSDNFNPPTSNATDYFRRPLPKPTGEGKDIGIGVSLFKNKLVARVNWFETINKDERTSAASTLLGRSTNTDTNTGLGWAKTVVRLRHGANPAVSNWNSDTVNPVTTDALLKEAWDLLKLPVNYYAGITSGATQNSKARGTELQVTYNPIPGWTMKLTASKQATTYTDIAPQFDEWIANRMPVWLSMSAPEFPDFVDGAGRAYSVKNFWTGYGFSNEARLENIDGNTSAQAYYNNTVMSQYALAKALEGAVAPTQRKYRASFLANYAFPRGVLKGVGVGSSVRWESKAAIGYYGKVGDPTLPTQINLSDVTRPVYDDGNIYTDLWISYTRKLFKDKVRMKVQLNVNNVFEDGHLNPIAVNFDGTPWAYRIIDPRQFILQTTFSF